jgi:hypothetical protein
MNVLSNLLTGLLKNWWAQRSASALRERIALLESYLLRMDPQHMLTEAEEQILRAVVGLQVFVMILFVLGLFGIGLLEIGRAPELTFRFNVILSVVTVVLVGAHGMFYSETMTFVQPRSPRMRRTIQEQVAKLKKKLANK